MAQLQVTGALDRGAGFFKSRRATRKPRMMTFRAVIFLVPGLLAPVAAVPAERIDAAYELTWSGIEIGRFETWLTADESNYRLAYAARTTGFLGWLFPFTSAGASNGSLANPGPVPARYVVESQWRDGTTSAVDFGPLGKVQRIDMTTPVDEERDPVPKALQKAPDPLALALRATRTVAPGARWEGVSFDGKRAVRFELACADAEHAFAPDDPAAPIHSALDCTIDGELIAGASRRWQSGRDTNRRPAHVLLSREIVPGRYWPVRVEVETRFGMVVIRLTRYQ
jgi:hypothetical protein